MLLLKKILILIFVFFKLSNCINFDFIINLLQQLNNIHNFKTLIIFQSEFFHEFELNEFYLKLQKNNSKIPKYCLTTTTMPSSSSTNKNIKLRNLINNNFISIIFISNNIDDPIFELIDIVLEKLHWTKIIFIILNDHLHSLLLPKKILKWCYLKHMLNSIVLFENHYYEIQIMNFESFPNFYIQNLNKNFNISNYNNAFLNNNKNLTEILFMYDEINDQKLNFKNAEFKATLLHSPPMTTTLYNKKIGRNIISGIGPYMIKDAKHLNNWKIKFINFKYSDDDLLNYETIYKLLKYKKINLCITPKELINDKYSYDISYPLYISKLCLIIPVKRLPTYMHLIHAFQNDAWLILSISIILLTILLYIAHSFNNKSNNNRLKKFEFGELFGQSLTGIFNLQFPISLQKIHNSIHIKFIYILILIFGFIISTIYITFATSYLTKIIIFKTINTIDDLIKKNIKILTTKEQLKYMINLRNYSKDFNNSFIIVNEYNYAKTVDSLNQSYAYAIFDYSLELLLKLQRNLHKPLFYQSKICFGSYFVSFPIQSDSLLRRSLKYLIIRYHQSGLLNYIIPKVYDELIEYNYIKPFKDTYNSGPFRLEMEHLKLLWYFWMIGIFISCICFLLEIIWIKIKIYFGKVLRKIKEINF